MEFMTAEEKQKVGQRLEQLKAKRPIIAKRIGEARALGDLSENADYPAAREDQGLLEAEIRRLAQKLKSAKVADDASIPQEMAFVGSTVTLRDTEDGSTQVYRLVGEVSGVLDLDSDVIEVSMGSPIGQALTKARVGDIVRVDLPRGSRRFEVIGLA